MNQFLADNIDQLDLALDQLAVSDRNFDRFALMLIDNVVELTLHQYIKDKATAQRVWGSSNRSEDDQKQINKGLGQNFGNKVKVSCKFGLLKRPICDSILNLHLFRNSSYHKGLRHEGILHSLAVFYLKCACELLMNYDPQFWSWSTSDEISYRAKKYLGSYDILEARKAFVTAFSRINEVAESLDHSLIQDLVKDMQSTIERTNGLIDFLSKEGPEKKTRDEVIIESQAMYLAFSNEGYAYTSQIGHRDTINENRIKWFIDNYQWKINIDPIPKWQIRLESLSKVKDEHRAIKMYCDFMKQTEKIRSQIEESADLLEGCIQQEIDFLRGK